MVCSFYNCILVSMLYIVLIVLSLLLIKILEWIKIVKKNLYIYL